MLLALRSSRHDLLPRLTRLAGCGSIAHLSVAGEHSVAQAPPRQQRCDAPRLLRRVHHAHVRRGVPTRRPRLCGGLRLTRDAPPRSALGGWRGPVCAGSAVAVSVRWRLAIGSLSMCPSRCNEHSADNETHGMDEP